MSIWKHTYLRGSNDHEQISTKKIILSHIIKLMNTRDKEKILEVLKEENDSYRTTKMTVNFPSKTLQVRKTLC